MTVTNQPGVLRPHRARAACRALLALLLAVAAIVPVTALPSSVRAADPPSFVILVDGLCSELPAGAQVTANFSGDGGLVQRLRAAGWPEESIVGFSYLGGNVG